MSITLPDLPFAPNALEPYMSARTFEYHHGKHHKAYIDKTNSLIAGTDLEGKSIEEIIAAAHKKGDQGLFNQAAQVWNHSFFWSCLSPKGGKPTGELAAAIDAAFGSFEAFCEKFVEAAMGQFGSGWAWLVLDGGALKISKTSNAGTPLVEGTTPLLTLDVWEHAYYLDHQNNRKGFADAFLANLVNWDFVAANLAAAKA